MQASQAGKCSNCDSSDAMLRAVYDWRRTKVEGAWVWLGTSRPLCPGCYADPRYGGRWIDERQKQTAQKPAWASDEPEEFDRPAPPVMTGPLAAKAASPSGIAKPANAFAGTETRTSSEPKSAGPASRAKAKRAKSKPARSTSRGGRKAK